MSTGSVNRLHTSPLDVPRTRRNHNIAVLTSLPAGLCVPVAAIPMLREDSLSAQVSINVEMLETQEILMNAVNLRVTAFLVPWLAFERFQGSRDQFDRSYMGKPKTEDVGETTTPFFATAALPAAGAGADPILRYLGLHGKPNQVHNTAYREAYNLIWNMRAKNRSMKILARALTLSTLAPAFWQHSRFAHVLPDFDQAVIDGEVALSFTKSKLPVRGIGFNTAAMPSLAASTSGRNQTDGTVGTAQASGTVNRWTASDPSGNNVSIKVQDNNNNFPDIWAELAEAGITVSLANLEMARKTQAFAKLREQFEGIEDEYIIDMLMDGLSIPDQAMKQPILLADQTTRFAQAKRYATDAGNLAESAVSGAATVNMSIRVPRLNTGGVVMVIAEAYPEQLFERQQDWFLHTTDQALLPEFLRDTLDPEKVDIVKNGLVDAAHATPDGTFGYAPLNWKYNAAGPKVGGKFFKGDGYAGSDAVRTRLWGVETANPVLSEDFYIVKNMHTKPFLDTASDPFEATVVGNAVIEGNTVFGGVLVESTTNYDKVAAAAPTTRIVKP